jgi:hypothetical protein
VKEESCPSNGSRREEGDKRVTVIVEYGVWKKEDGEGRRMNEHIG